MASSVLVELPAREGRGDTDGLRFVFDMGRGVAHRLVEQGLAQDDVEHVVLSHFHPDHLSDLVPYLHAAAWSRIDPRRRDLHVHGPPGLETQLMRLLSLFGPDDLRRDHYRVHLHEVRDGTVRMGGRELAFRPLPPAGNHGLRFTASSSTGSERTVVLTGDSDFHDAEVELLRDVDLAVIDSGHLEDDEIVELAVRSAAREIVCSHLYREIDAVGLGARARERGYSGRLRVGRDGEEILLASLR